MKCYSVDLRQKIIDVREQEKLSIRKLAQRFQVAPSFVQKLLKQYQDTGDIKPRKRGGNQVRKLGDDQVITLIEIMENNNDATLKELGEMLAIATKIEVSTTTIWKITKKFNYSWKKKTMYAAEKTSERGQKKRAEFRELLRDVPAEDLIFVDESGVNLAMVRLYARAKKDQRARGKRPQKRGKNISIISALSLEEVLASSNIYGSVDTVVFEAFIVTKLVPKLWQGAYVIIDNAKIHFGKIVKEAIENVGAKLIYLSPYSPEFSPIENFWSKVKSLLRKLQARTYQNLIDSITDAMLQVTQNDIRNWFTHCCYCTSK